MLTPVFNFTTYICFTIVLTRIKKKNLLNFVTFKKFLEKSAFLKLAAQACDTGDFLNIFLRFWSFWGLFSNKNFSYIKKTCRIKFYCTYYYQYSLILEQTISVFIFKKTFIKNKPKRYCLFICVINFPLSNISGTGVRKNLRH